MIEDDDNWLIETSIDYDLLCTFPTESLMKSQAVGNSKDHIVFHHTTLNALSPIIEGRMFRFTRYDRMRNDETEGDYIYKLFSDVCDEIESELGPELYNALKDISSEEPFIECYKEANRSVEAIPYVACFTRMDFSDTLRGRYCSDVTLKLDVSRGFPDRYQKDQEGEYLNVHVARVMYDTEQIKSNIRSALRKAHELQPDTEKVVLYMRQMLTLRRLLIKKEFFKDEYETRVIIFIPKDLEAHPEIEEMIPKQATIRCNDRLIKTVVDFNPGDDYLFLPFNHTGNLELIRSDRTTDTMIAGSFVEKTDFVS